jgi:hypothetical protein
LYKFGFEKIAKCSCFSTYTKPEVETEMSNPSKISVSFVTIKLKTKLSGQSMSSSDFLTPSMCFKECKNNAECGAASFTIDPTELVNCILFYPSEYTVDNEANDFWTSYLKKVKTSTKPVILRTVTKTTKLATTSTVRSMIQHKGARNNLQERTSLTGHYSTFRSSGKAECFDKCDEEGSKCAAACFTTPNRCRLLKYGFETDYNQKFATAYVKPEVSEELGLSLNRLNELYPHVKPNTRLVGEEYMKMDMLTPSLCYAECKESGECGAAGFTVQTKFSHNCFLFRHGQFSESSGEKGRKLGAHHWTSYVKVEV